MFTGLKARCINVVCHSAIAQTYTAVANFYETYHHYLEELRRFSVYVTSTERLIVSEGLVSMSLVQNASFVPAYFC